jgi:hypothetical protein
VDVQVEMSSLIYMLLFSARLGNFRHADPYGKIFHKTLINRKIFNFLYQLAQISLRLGLFRALTFLQTLTSSSECHVWNNNINTVY